MPEQPKFTSALEQFQQGQLIQAQSQCEALLQVQPRDAEAWHLLGLIHYQQQALAAAAEALKKAVQLQPGAVHFRVNLAHVYLDQQAYAQAAKHYEKALKKYESAELRLLWAQALQALGQAIKARQQVQRATQLEPQNPQVWYRLGLLQHELNQPEAALQAYQQVLSLAPQHAQAWHNRGVLLQTLGQVEPAQAHYAQALRHQPRYAQAAYSLACLLEQQGQIPAAVEHYQLALQLEPGFELAALNLSHLALAADQPAAAEQIVRQVLAHRPEATELWLQLGQAQQAQQQLQAARESYLQLLQIQPQHPGAEYNLGHLAQQQGQWQAAQAHYAAALQLTHHPQQQARIRYAQSTLKLLLGDFEAGWADYAARWDLPHAETPQAPDLPEWRGEPLQGKHLLVYAEQGFGDQIQFLRYVQLLRKQTGLARLTCLVAEPLLRLCQSLDVDQLERLRPASAWQSPELKAQHPADYRVALMSLPQLLQTRLESIPNTLPYLQPPPQEPDTQPTLPATPAPQRRIGLVWAAGQVQDPIGKQAYALKSIEPAALQVLKQVPDARFFSLQIGPDQLSAEALATAFDWLHDLSPQIHDFADTAAWLQQLDLVITVDTAVAHLAGALARPVWVLLPQVPDWRWLLARSDSPWYPGMRLFRQSRPGDWQSVLQEVLAALAEDRIR